MELSNVAAFQFARTVNGKKKDKTESTVYGTIVVYGGEKYVKMDGSDLLTPCDSTVSANEGERVTVLVKNHSATVNGNLSSPAARSGDVEEVKGQVLEVQQLVADKADIKDLEAERARIGELVADNAVIKGRVSASEADIGELQADNAKITGRLDANEANIKKLDAEKLTATDAELKYASVENLNATNAKVGDLEADNATVKGKLDAAEGRIDNLETDNVYVKGRLDAAEGNIKNLDAEKLSATNADLKYATIESLKATDAKIGDLEADNVTINQHLDANDADIKSLRADKLNATDADLKYANIDFSNIGVAAMEKFYSESGLIKDVVVGNQTITGELVGVTIKGDLIEGNTIKAEKLVIKGEDGLYYKLNTNGSGVTSEQTDYNSLNGTVIQAKSITADKVAVTDLVAFGADIGGNHVGHDCIYSGAKTSALNTTRGFYLGSDGQVGFGDANNYIQFYKGDDGEFHLRISTEDLYFTSGKESVKTIVDEAAKVSKDASNTAQKALDTLAGISTLDAISATLDNDAHVVHTNTDGSGGVYGDCHSTIYLYSGNTDVTKEVEDFIIAPSGSISGVWSVADRTYQVSDCSSDDGFVDITCVYGLESKALVVGGKILTIAGKAVVIKTGARITKRFSVSKAKDGKIGVSYSIQASTNIVRKQKDGTTLMPSSIVFSAFENDNGNTTSYFGKFIIEESQDDGKSYTVLLDDDVVLHSLTYSPSSPLVNLIRCALYDPLKRQKLDSQTVTIISDADGLAGDIDDAKQAAANAQKTANEAVKGNQETTRQLGDVKSDVTGLQTKLTKTTESLTGLVGNSLLYNVVYKDNENGTTTLSAVVYRNGLEVTKEFPEYWFSWTKRTESIETFIRYGYTVTVNNDEYIFGGVVIGTFITYKSAALVVNGKLLVIGEKALILNVDSA